MIQLEDRLYTSTEVAEVLGVSLRSVYRYLEEGKIDAEIKTATGRHRFSKKNIMDFLYPNGSSAPRTMTEESVNKPVFKKPIVEEKTPYAAQEDLMNVNQEKQSAFQSQTSNTNSQQSISNQAAQDTPSEEPVDWLAKFREAAKKFREESSEPVQVPQEGAGVRDTSAQIQEKFSGFTTTTTEAPKDQITTKVIYYKSSLGGLKDIAQNIDKSSRSANLSYAFTMNAGLSLYKPIKPFSVLHAYVKPQDLPFYDRTLGLSECEESGAQLCLLVSSDGSVFSEREEMHGLFVVSKRRLLDDIIKMGDSSLADEAKSVL